MNAYRWAALVLVASGGVAATAFVIIYTVVSNWWKSREGIHLFGFTLTIALLLDLSVAVWLIGPFFGIRAISLIIYAAISGFMWQRLWLLLSADRRHQ